MSSFSPLSSEAISGFSFSAEVQEAEAVDSGYPVGAVSDDQISSYPEGYVPQADPFGPLAAGAIGSPTADTMNDPASTTAPPPSSSGPNVVNINV